MAQSIGNFIDRIQIGTDEAHQIAIGSSAYGVCDTIASEAAKTVNIPGFALNTGTTVHIKFTYTNSVASPTLNISNTGAKSIMQYDITNVGTIEETTGWQAGAVLTLTYDGTNWIRDQGYNTNTIYNNGTGLNLTNNTFSVKYGNTAGTAVEGNSLPTINNARNYDSNSTLFAPETSGAQYQILISDGTNKAPVWASEAKIVSATSTTADTNAYTILTLGNNNNVSSTSAHSEGKLELYSAATASHIIQGMSTITNYTHTLPSADGYIVQTPSNAAVGNNTRPIYIDNTGTAQALTYVPNRLYYSTAAASGETDSVSFEATGHYASEAALAINTTSITNGFNFEVNGNVKITGNIVPTTTNTYNLGIKGNDPKRWKALYIGMSDTYGSPTQSIYWNDGVPEALIYTANRLYYSATTTSFEATGHYATSTELALNQTTAITSGYTLEVNGKTKLNDELTISDSTPKIVFDTSTSGVSDWVLINNGGNISLNNQNNTLSELLGTDVGFKISNRLYINANLPSQAPYTYNLYVNGDIGVYEGNIIPLRSNNNDNYSLGDGGNSAHRWSAAFIGTADTYGDPYLPIYWDNGVPTTLDGVIQYKEFSFDTTDNVSDTASIILQSDAYNASTYVSQIVVSSGADYLNGPISWSSDTGTITLTTTAVSGAISGYILTSRGCVAPVPSNS